MIKLASAALLFLALIGPVGADDRRTGRYAFVPVEEGTFRLDTQTGRVAFCGGTGAAIACTDSPVAADQAVAALEARLAKIERRLAVMEASAGQNRQAAANTPLMRRLEALSERAVSKLINLVRGFKQGAGGEHRAASSADLRRPHSEQRQDH